MRSETSALNSGMFISLPPFSIPRGEVPRQCRPERHLSATEALARMASPKGQTTVRHAQLSTVASMEFRDSPCSALCPNQRLVRSWDRGCTILQYMART
jgi:hypothetical protein